MSSAANFKFISFDIVEVTSCDFQISITFEIIV